MSNFADLMTDSPDEPDIAISYLGLPDPDERRTYLMWWKSRLASEAPVSEAVVETAVQVTDDFSFSDLRDLILSTLIEWFSEGGTRDFEDVLVEQAQAHRAEMGAG